jgi:dihydroorotate dehydrogenase (NAD+) catalytic subunit
MVELQSSLLNSIGLQNPGVEDFIAKKLPFLLDYELPLIVNVVGDSLEEYMQVVEPLDSEKRVDGFEINLSCPNVERGLEFGTTFKGVERITKSLRALTRKPLWIKLSPMVSDPRELGRAAEAAGADALVAINTLGGMVLDLEKRKPVLGAQFGGVSGPAVKPIAVKYVWQLYDAVSIPIIGVGGIMKGEDAVEFLMAGATAIQVGTANFVNPLAMPDVLRELSEWMQAHGFESVPQIVGSAHPRSN